MFGFVCEGEYQDYIVQHLTSQPILDANGNITAEMEYHEISASEYNKPGNKDNCILVSELVAFLKDTQPEQYQKIFALQISKSMLLNLLTVYYLYLELIIFHH